MKRKKLLAVMMTTVLAVSVLFGGCGDSKDSGEKGGKTAMTDGYYYISISGLDSFVRFNEDGTYYASYFNGGVKDAGSYEVLDEELEYFSEKTGEDNILNNEEGAEKKTADQVVALTSMLDGSTVKVAYVDDTLMDMSLGGMANHRYLEHKADYAYDPENDEQPIQIQNFYAGGSTGNSLTMSHDKSFVDATGDELLEGSWEQKSETEYTLKYDDGTEGNLVIAADKKTAVLTRGEQEIPVENANAPVGSLTLNCAEAEVGLPMKVELRLDCVEDGSCTLYVVVAAVNAEIPVDQGTYTLTDTGLALQLENAGTISGTVDAGNVSVTYTGTTSGEFNGMAVDFNIDAVLTGTI